MAGNGYHFRQAMIARKGQNNQRKPLVFRKPAIDQHLKLKNNQTIKGAATKNKRS